MLMIMWEPRRGTISGEVLLGLQRLWRLRWYWRVTVAVLLLALLTLFMPSAVQERVAGPLAIVGTGMLLALIVASSVRDLRRNRVSSSAVPVAIRPPPPASVRSTDFKGCVTLLRRFILVFGAVFLVPFLILGGLRIGVSDVRSAISIDSPYSLSFLVFPLWILVVAAFLSDTAAEPERGNRAWPVLLGISLLLGLALVVDGLREMAAEPTDPGRENEGQVAFVVVAAIYFFPALLEALAAFVYAAMPAGRTRAQAMLWIVNASAAGATLGWFPALFLLTKLGAM